MYIDLFVLEYYIYTYIVKFILKLIIIIKDLI